MHRVEMCNLCKVQVTQADGYYEVCSNTIFCISLKFYLENGTNISL